MPTATAQDARRVIAAARARRRESAEPEPAPAPAPAPALSRAAIKPSYLAAFEPFDPLRTGIVDPEHLRKALAELGCALPEDGLQSLEEIFRTDDCRVDYIGLLAMACASPDSPAEAAAEPEPEPDAAEAGPPAGRPRSPKATHESPATLPQPAALPASIVDGDLMAARAESELAELGLELSSPVRRRLFAQGEREGEGEGQGEGGGKGDDEDDDDDGEKPPAYTPPRTSQATAVAIEAELLRRENERLRRERLELLRAPDKTADVQRRLDGAERQIAELRSAVVAEPKEGDSPLPQPRATRPTPVVQQDPPPPPPPDGPPPPPEPSELEAALQRKELEKVKLQRQVRAAQTAEQRARGEAEELKQRVASLEQELARSRGRLQSGMQTKARAERRVLQLERQLADVRRGVPPPPSSPAPAPAAAAPAPAAGADGGGDDDKAQTVARLRVQLARRTTQVSDQASEIKHLKAALEQLRAAERPRELAALRAQLASAQAKLAEAERRRIEAPPRSVVVERSPAVLRRRQPPAGKVGSPSPVVGSPGSGSPRSGSPRSASRSPRRGKASDDGEHNDDEDDDDDDRVLPASLTEAVAQANASPLGETSRVRAYAQRRERMREAKRRLRSGGGL